MAERSDVSVVMPSYNSAEFIGRAIDSVLSQTAPPREIIVVDDGSTDDTASVVERFGPKVVLHRQANAGPSAARNNGIRLSNGELVAFLDADDMWEPDKLARQLAVMAADPSAVMCHTQMRLIDAKDLPGDLGWGGTYRTYADLLLGCGVCTSSVLVRREPLFRAGLYDPLYAAAHDYDLWLKLSRLGPMIPIADPLVRYRWHDNNISRQYLRTHREITEIMTRHLEIARRGKAADHFARARRGLRQTRQSTARQALVAAVVSAKTRRYAVAAGHLFTAVRFDPARTLGQLAGRIGNQFRPKSRVEP